MKYDTWNVSGCQPEAASALVKAGISPLAALVLCSRGQDTPEKVSAFLAASHMPLHDPFLMQDMSAAAARVRRAAETGERIAVYGDYDVDGITATCLLMDFLRSLGADTTYYIPGRLEEGYGLNAGAVRRLADDGVRLIITVDCGITAVTEARLCRELGMDLVITDHHECGENLPDAAAVVDPCRHDCSYPFSSIAGVAVAFKLACAISGDTPAMLARYCDLVALGTVADVMPLLDENRTLVCAGLESLRRSPRLGLDMLMAECGLDRSTLTASSIGYILAPRINAAGRMGQVPLAVELLLTGDRARAAELAADLCRLNRQRQAVEAGIYAEATAQLSETPPSGAVVLAAAGWHQGVVGIVASRLAEEYACPAFLICLDGPHSKASSRSWGGFNLYAALSQLSPLLESYGGHELAAGFTIDQARISDFRREMSALCAGYAASGRSVSTLPVDCELTDPSLLTLENVAGLDLLEPTGAGFPRPAFYMTGLTAERVTEVGGGRHLKLRLRRGRHILGAMFFSMTAAAAGIAEGDTVEIVFTPQINEFRGTRSVQLNLLDIRPAADLRRARRQESALYEKHRAGLPLTSAEAAALLPPRSEFAALWRYLEAHADGGRLQEDAACLCRNVARSAGVPCSLSRLRLCLDVLCERGLLDLQDSRRGLIITLRAGRGSRKVDLTRSRILIELQNTVDRG